MWGRVATGVRRVFMQSAERIHEAFSDSRARALASVRIALHHSQAAARAMCCRSLLDGGASGCTLRSEWRALQGFHQAR